MNERIQELAERARKYARDYVADCKHYGYYMEHNELEVKFEQKFAELIVKECMQVADEGMAQVTMRVEWPSYHIKKHFGVEE